MAVSRNFGLLFQIVALFGQIGDQLGHAVFLGLRLRDHGLLFRFPLNGIRIGHVFALLRLVQHGVSRRLIRLLGKCGHGIKQRREYEDAVHVGAFSVSSFLAAVLARLSIYRDKLMSASFAAAWRNALSSSVIVASTRSVWLIPGNYRFFPGGVNPLGGSS